MPITTKYRVETMPISEIRVVNDNPMSGNAFRVRNDISGGPERSLHLGFEKNNTGLYMTAENARKFAADLVAFADQIEAGR